MTSLPRARDALVAEPWAAVLPPALEVLDCLEHHTQPAATESAIRLRRAQCVADLHVVRPVAALARLPGEVGFDDVTGTTAVTFADLRDQLGDQLRVALGRGAHQHAAHHPALDDIERFGELLLRDLAIFWIQEAEYERLDDFTPASWPPSHILRQNDTKPP